MKQKSELRSNDAEPEKRWVRRSLSRARVQLGQVVAEALGPSTSKPGDAAFGRMRELLQQDRANLVVQSTKPSKTKSAPPPPPRAAYNVASPAASAAPAPSPAPAPVHVPAATATAVTGTSSARHTSPASTAAPAQSSAAAASSEEQALDPIRTLTMARLLAVQGYRKRALSIYDELLAQNATDASLRAEADRLRG